MGGARVIVQCTISTGTYSKIYGGVFFRSVI